MADEVKMISKHWFVQKPNLYFPIELHFYLPFFQFYSLGLRATLHNKFNLGFMKKKANPLEARIEVEMTRFLSKKEIKYLFPESSILTE